MNTLIIIVAILAALIGLYLTAKLGSGSAIKFSIETNIKKDILYFKIEEGVKLPKYAKPGDAGMDISAYIPPEKGGKIIVPAKGWVLIPSGVRADIPKGYEIQVRSRSGLALKQGVFVLNGPGTIDEQFKGDIGVILANFGNEDFVVNHGDRIAQLVLSKVDKLDIKTTSSLSESERGEGGFGHTGV